MPRFRGKKPQKSLVYFCSYKVDLLSIFVHFLLIIRYEMNHG